MEFLQLKYFQHAAKSENFSHTAAAFMVPASSVSLSIKKLENEMGAVFFDRTANKLSLNENGKIFLKTVDSIFYEIDKAKNLISDISGEARGRINMLITTNRQPMTKIISDFRARYPKVSFALEFGESKNYKDYDILITDSILDNNSFERYDFVLEEIMLAVHKDNPLAKRKQINMSMLENEKFLCLHKRHSLRTITDSLCDSAGIKPDIAIECDDPQCIRDYLKMGMGVSLIPTVSWNEYIDKSLTLLRINNGVYRESKIYINKESSQSAKIFFKHIQTYKFEK